MNTSYSKNTHISKLFFYYAFDSQVSLSSCMSVKVGLFFFLTFCCIIISVSGIIDHYCFMENFKKVGKNKNKLRLMYLKNPENFKNNKPSVQFYWFLYKKKECIHICNNFIFIFNLEKVQSYRRNFQFSQVK